MLDTQKAIRIEMRVAPCGSSYTACVFLCKGCGKEFAPTLSDCKTATGLCRKCTSKANGNTRCKRPFESRFNTIRSVAISRGHSFALTFVEYLDFVNQVCHYCGRELPWAPYGPQGSSNLDRKDNALGYSKDNCVACCWSCNAVKGNRFSYSQMMKLAPVLLDIRKEEQ